MFSIALELLFVTSTLKLITSCSCISILSFKIVSPNFGVICIFIEFSALTLLLSVIILFEILGVSNPKVCVLSSS